MPKKSRSRPMVDMFDGRSASVIPAAVGCGEAYALRDRATLSSAAVSSRTELVFITNTGDSSFVGVSVLNNTTPYLQTIKALMADVALDTTRRAMKASVTIMNSTSRLHQSGIVRVLNVTNRLAFPLPPTIMTQSQWDDVILTIRSHPDTVPYVGSQLDVPHTFVTHPVDHAKYENFNITNSAIDFATAADEQDFFFDHICTYPSQAKPLPRPMSTIAIIFEMPPADTNYYNVATRASWYCRFPLSTIASRAQKPIPTAPQMKINSAVAHAVKTKDTPRHGPDLEHSNALRAGPRRWQTITS